MRKIALGLVVASFFFSAWQLAVSGSRHPGSIPMLAAPVPTPSAQFTSTSDPRPACGLVRYATRPEDTLAGMAARFSTSEEEILALNHLPGGRVAPGTALIIPVCKPTPTGTAGSPEQTLTHTPAIHRLTTTPAAKY